MCVMGSALAITVPTFQYLKRRWALGSARAWSFCTAVAGNQDACGPQWALHCWGMQASGSLIEQISLRVGLLVRSAPSN